MNKEIRVVPLGAGQDVGRSCVLVSIGSKNVMFDCGMHMGYNDHRRFPDFAYLQSSSFLGRQGGVAASMNSAARTDFTALIDCVIISHFHLDHCGALPYFSEICGYDGPIYMTHPTRAIAPILLEDMRKVSVERKGETDFFTSQDIKNCMRKVIPVGLLETIQVDDELEIKPYYAGHVLGAAMFHVRVNDAFKGSLSVVYTGDYNMTPDRHLGAAWIEPCEPDLIITETTYATTIRDSKRARERDFLKKVHDAVRNGGKVLIPVFALGRAQELLILIESYWKRMNDLSQVPVYFSTGLTQRANEYYRLFITWTNENIKTTFYEHNLFDFAHIKNWDSSYADEPKPMVLFATPGMLHAGTSLEVFKKWCHDPRNVVILPGFCVAGTVGAKVLAGEKVIDVDKYNKVNVNMKIENLSFSAHADAKGILQLLRMSNAKNVMLVHGEKQKMASLKERIQNELNVRCFNPANGEVTTIVVPASIPAFMTESLYSACYFKQRPTIEHLRNVNSNTNRNVFEDDMDIDSLSLRPLQLQVIRPIHTIAVEASVAIEPPKQVLDLRLDSSGNRAPRSVAVIPPRTTVMSIEDAKENFQIHPIKFTFRIQRQFNKMVLFKTHPYAMVNIREVPKIVLEHIYHELDQYLPQKGHDVEFDVTKTMILVGHKHHGSVEGASCVAVQMGDIEKGTIFIQWTDESEELATQTLALVSRTFLFH